MTKTLYLESSGFKGRMPRLVACGSRTEAFSDFRTAQADAQDYVALLVDSEEPVANVEAPWEHLRARDGLERPTGVEDDQALLMTTCMETWIVADRKALASHYGQGFRPSALPALEAIEGRSRSDVQDRLVTATRGCSKAYAKGKRSFEILARLDPDVLEAHLPSFARARRILKDRL